MLKNVRNSSKTEKRIKMRRKQAIWKTNWQSLIKVHENTWRKINNQRMGMFLHLIKHHSEI